jgi:hypothetical protein
MNYQIGKCYQICHIVAHMGGDVVVVTVGTLASHNILQHPSASLIRICYKYWMVVGFIGLVSGLNCGLPGPTRLVSVQCDSHITLSHIMAYTIMTSFMTHIHYYDIIQDPDPTHI